MFANFPPIVKTHVVVPAITYFVDIVDHDDWDEWGHKIGNVNLNCFQNLFTDLVAEIYKEVL